MNSSGSKELLIVLLYDESLFLGYTVSAPQGLCVTDTMNQIDKQGEDGVCSLRKLFSC